MASRWNLLWVLPWMVVSVLAVEFLVWLPIFLVGLVLFWPLLWLCPIVPKESTINMGQPVLAFKWAWANELWGNHEDGLNPDWWAAKGGTPWTWYLRNPVCNARFWPIISTLPSPGTRFIGSDQIAPGCRFIAWAGPYAGFRWEGKVWGVWFGWKVSPADQLGCADYRRFGLGIAMQLLRE